MQANNQITPVDDKPLFNTNTTPHNEIVDLDKLFDEALDEVMMSNVNINNLGENNNNNDDGIKMIIRKLGTTL